MKRLITLLLVCVSSVAVSTAAFARGRTVNLEWEAEMDASNYEIEIGLKGSSKPFQSQSKLTQPTWTGVLNPGRYWMHVRGRDDRDVPGEWSELVHFDVRLDAPKVVEPEDQAVIDGTGETSSVTLKWNAVEGASAYSVVVMNDLDKVVATERTPQTSLAVSLGNAMKYTWVVQALDENGEPGMKIERPAAFTLRAPAIDAPEVRQPASAFVREIEFARPTQADNLHLIVKRFNPSSKEWDVVTEGRLRKPTLQFRPQWAGGRYQVFATSEAKYRAPSSVSVATFDVADGPRTPEAENRALIRQAIDRTDDWFVSASYVMSSISYSASLTEENRSADYSALTGGLVAGVGRFKANSPFGLFGSLEANGYRVEGSSATLLGAELNGLYRLAPNRESDLRLRAGAFFKEAPQLTSITNGVTLGSLSSFGPLLGVDYLYSLSPKWAVQSTLALKLGLLGTSAQNAPVTSAFSYQAGLLAGYRALREITVLGGYSYRHESYGFTATNDTLGVTGDDKIEIGGHYLQLLLEYDF